jgi:hypothetical protein
MVWRIVVLWVVAVAMAGCAGNTGPDFSTLSGKLGPPRGGQARLVLLRESSIQLGSYDVKLDGTPLSGLKSGTYVYADVAAGTHQLTADEIMFPGTTQHPIAMQPGRTYFVLVKRSQKSNALMVMGAVGGLTGWAIGALATSKSENPGPLDFVPMDSAAAKSTMAELKLGS